MISPSPKSFASLQVVRPVYRGEKFLAQAREECMAVIGQKAVSSLAKLQFVGDSAEIPTVWSNDVYEPNATVTPPDELELVLLHRAVQRGSARYYRVQETVVDLSNSGPRDGAAMAAALDSTTDVLRDGCALIAQNAHQRFVGGLIHFDRVVKLPAVHKKDDYSIYALAPKPDDMTTELNESMARLAEDSLEHVNPGLAGMISVCGLKAASGIVAPFARIPRSAEGHDSRLIVELWNDLLSGETSRSMSLGDVLTIAR